MTQYIDKSALVAEIEKRIEEYKSMKIDSSYYDGMIASLEFLRDEFIDTLEVKEVDLDRELSYKDYKSFFKKYPNLSDDWGFEEAWTFAQYFFELGLKA